MYQFIFISQCLIHTPSNSTYHCFIVPAMSFDQILFQQMGSLHMKDHVFYGRILSNSHAENGHIGGHIWNETLP